MNTTFDIDFYEQKGFGKGKPLLDLGEGDSCLFFDVLDGNEVGMIVFEELREEVQWGHMKNREKCVQRLVAIQGTVDEHPESGNLREPLYRHPADEQPSLSHWTPTIDKIRNQIMKEVVPEQHLNHCLIQLYRTSKDNISEHADKTIDIERGSNILNYSAGATRIMTLRTKKPLSSEDRKYNIQKVALPHNSVFILGWNTNRLWKHSIKADNRPPKHKRADELLNNGQRISLTFRQVSTFLRHVDGKVYGQGGKYKTEEELDNAITKESIPHEDKEAESRRLLEAFSAENHTTDFNWDHHYSVGFNILNFKTLT